MTPPHHLAPKSSLSSGHSVQQSWVQNSVLALSRQPYDNTHLISDSVFLSVRYGAENYLSLVLKLYCHLR